MLLNFLLTLLLVLFKNSVALGDNGYRDILIPLSNMEKTQDELEDWVCGIHSATRLLNSYGINVSLEQMTEEIGPLSIAEINSGKIKTNKVDMPIGNTPKKIHEVMKKYHSKAKVMYFAHQDFILNLIKQHKPFMYITLIGPEKIDALGIEIPLLHWNIVNGFRKNPLYDELFIKNIDTYSNFQYVLGFNEFDNGFSWNQWPQVSPWKDEDNLKVVLEKMIFAALDHELGRKTIIWIDEKIPVDVREFQSEWLEHGSQVHLPFYEGFMKESGRVSECHFNDAYEHALNICKNNLGKNNSDDIFLDISLLQKTFVEKFWRKGGVVGQWTNTGARACSFSGNLKCYALR